MGELKKMLDPQSVAVIGASEREGSVGSAIVTNLTCGYTGHIFLVNPKREHVMGRPCYPSVLSLPRGIDLAVIAVPAPSVPDVTEACGKAGVEGAVIISAGFGEANETGRRLEARVAAMGKKYGTRIIGPGSLGLIRPDSGLNTTFLKSRPEKGNIAVVSQSGQLVDAILDWAALAHVGLSMFTSLGSMVDVDFGDLIDFLGEDFTTRSMLLNMERVVNARKFMSAARGFARTKPIVVLKPGRFPETVMATAGDRGMIPGDDGAYDAAFKRVGVVRAGEAREVFNAARALDSTCLPRGPRLAILSNGGAVGLMALDALVELGGRRAELSSESIARLISLLPANWNKKNPVDLGGDAYTEQYTAALRLCLKDPSVDGVLVIHTPRAKAAPADLARALASHATMTGKPVIAAFMGGEARHAVSTTDGAGVPTYETPEEAVRTYLQMYRYKRNLELLYETPAELPRDLSRPARHLRPWIEEIIKKGKRVLTDEQSLDFLKEYGFPVAATTGTPKGTRRGNGALPALYLTMSRDRDFGSVIRFGLGGVARELLEDCAVGLPPLNQTLARRLIEESKFHALVQEQGDKGAEEMARLEEVIVLFSDLIVDFPEITAITIDPLVPLKGDFLVLDAHVSLARPMPDGHAPYPHLVITPYPTHYTTHWLLKDGEEVLLRPIRPEDEPLQYELFSTLSEQTIRERFFSPIEDMPHDLLVRFCNIDYEREIAIVAETGYGDRRRIVGISRLIIQSGSKAEFAVLVHDDYQHRGLGRKLVEVLIEIAREKRLEEMYGSVLSENRPMLGLLRTLGFDTALKTGGIVGASLKISQPNTDLLRIH